MLIAAKRLHWSYCIVMRGWSSSAAYPWQAPSRRCRGPELCRSGKCWMASRGIEHGRQALRWMTEQACFKEYMAEDQLMAKHT